MRFQIKLLIELTFAFAVVSAVFAEIDSSGKPALSIGALRKRRKEMAAKRRVIFNNDGCDAEQIFPGKWKATPDNLLKLRGYGLLGSDVTTISYCDGSTSFAQFTHNTKVGELQTENTSYAKRYHTKNITAPLLKQGTDPFRVYVDFARKHGLEIFWSRRMNDTHDVSRSATNSYFPYWSRFKEKHPEYLFGKMSEHFKNGRWSAVDFSYPETRRLTVEYFREICENYDIDGIELDFFRHLFLFRNVGRGGVAAAEQLAMMTDMMRKIREMTEKVGLSRGSPILISVRVADSPEYCEKVGIDLRRWCDEDLIDLVIGGGYFRLAPWRNWVAFAREHHTNVVAGLSDPRVQGESVLYRRLSDAAYRGRAMDAWRSGVDGLYIFNEYQPDNAAYLSEIGSLAKLRFLSKLYFNTYMTGSPDEYLNGGSRFLKFDRLYPGHPLTLSPEKSGNVTIDIGDNFTDDLKIDPGKRPVCVIHAKTPKLANAKDMAVSVNGVSVDDTIFADSWLHARVVPEHLKPGTNYISFKWNGKPSGGDGRWDMQYVCDKKLTYPKQLPWRRLFPCAKSEEKIVDSALFLADYSSGKNQMNNLAYPWNVDPAGLTVVETSMKLVETSDPLGVCLRLANGEYVEYLTFSPTEIGLLFTGLKYEMDTTGEFHEYKLEWRKKSLRVFVDGKLAIDGKNVVTTKISDPQTRLNFAMGNGDAWNAKSLIFGSCDGKATGSAYWRFIRYRSSVITIDDLALSVEFTDKGKKYSLSQIIGGGLARERFSKTAIVRSHPEFISPKLIFSNTYDPAQGYLPDAAGVIPRWRGTYRKKSLHILKDEFSKEWALEIDNTGEGRNNYPRFIIDKRKYTGEKRFLVADFKLRMLGNTEKARFHFAVSRELPDGRFAIISLRFHPDWLEAFSGRSARYERVELGNAWHDYRIVADFKKRRFDVYLDGSSTPILSTRMRINATSNAPLMAFGDGSSSINGIVRLGELKWSWLNTAE